jgi:hypothetical protein
MRHDLHVVAKHGNNRESSVHLDGVKLEGVRRVEVTYDADSQEASVLIELWPGTLKVECDEAEIETREVEKIDLDIDTVPDHPWVMPGCGMACERCGKSKAMHPATWSLPAAIVDTHG